MDTICLDDVKALIRKGDGARVSIFMPTHHAGGENPQDPIRLKNLLRQAEEKLIARGLRTTEVRAMLAPAEKLSTDNLFWRQQSDGLALFIETNGLFYYRLPLEMKEQVGVADRFYIKPLVTLVNDCGWFYVLSLSRHENRLLQCTSSGSVRITSAEMPKNMPDSLFLETPDGRMQYHITSQVGGSNFGATSAIQSGQKNEPNYDKRNVLLYFEQVNKGVTGLLRQEKAPLVLSAVDYLQPLYRSGNTYPNLLPEGVPGNPDGVSDATLREQAWMIVKPYFAQVKKDAAGQFNQAAGTGKTATGFQEVIKAAKEGRVRFLFLAEGLQQWGVVEAKNDSVTVHAKAEQGDEDLMDTAAAETMGHGGSIFLMPAAEVPGGAPLAAVLRF